MGADARWVCHTCKTVCSRGGRPMLNIGASFLADNIPELKARVSFFAEAFMLDDKDRYISFLDNLYTWLSRHKEHNIHIGSDYSIDGMSLEEYYDELLDGTISKMTRIEAQLACFDQWQESSVRDIEETIKRHGKNTHGAAVELHNRLAMRVD